MINDDKLVMSPSPFSRKKLWGLAFVTRKKYSGTTGRAVSSFRHLFTGFSHLSKTTRQVLLKQQSPLFSKITGTALVLDEIINHVQTLQRQVEVLSMKLAAVNPRIDFNLDAILAADSGSLTDSNFPAIMMPILWPAEVQGSANMQQYQQWSFDAIHPEAWGRENDHNFVVTPENSLLSYVSSANSVSLNSNQLKMEL